MGLEIRVLVQVFLYPHTSCMQAAKALARLHGCVGLPESWLLADECNAIHAVGLEIQVLVQVFIYAHTSCMQAEKALAILNRCAGWPES